MQQNCHIRYMNLALLQANEALKKKEIPIGAILVKDNQIIASGYNQTIALNDPTAHAEIICLRQAGQLLKNYRLTGCELYVTVEPCAMCLGALMHARLAKVYFGAYEAKTGAIMSAHNLIDQNCFNHKLIVEHGILADECASMMQNFFRSKRKRTI